MNLSYSTFQIIYNIPANYPQRIITINAFKFKLLQTCQVPMICSITEINGCFVRKFNGYFEFYIKSGIIFSISEKLLETNMGFFTVMDLSA